MKLVRSNWGIIFRCATDSRILLGNWSLLVMISNVCTLLPCHSIIFIHEALCSSALRAEWYWRLAECLRAESLTTGRPLFEHAVYVFLWYFFECNEIYDYLDRMPVPIGKFISERFYHDRLKSCHSIRTDTCCRFVDVNHGFEVSRGGSWIVSSDPNFGCNF